MCHTKMPNHKGNLFFYFLYEGWNFNFGNAAVTFDTTHLQEFILSQTLDVLPKVM